MNIDFHHKLVFAGSQILWKKLRTNNIAIYNSRDSLVAQMVKNLTSMPETPVQSLGRKDLLEKGMATHSSILAWRIPWTEEPGRLHFMELQSQT